MLLYYRLIGVAKCLNLALLHVNYLLLQLELSGAVEVSVYKQSLKDINATSTIYLFIFLRKKKEIESEE